MNKVVYT